MNNGGPTLSSAQLALAIRRMRAERPDADLVNSNPIAIIGMGCRYPGNVRSPQDYWRLLRDGVDAISKAVPDRWDASYYDPDPQCPGKMNSCWGGFLTGVDQFDPLLFGISPREASSIDPQQRLLLEVAWETIWDSGRAPESLAGSRTGVFVAMVNSDYEQMLFANDCSIGPHSCTGGYRSVASGRISFLLDLHGPSISMDTACSSSLSVIHGACQSLRTGECDLALAGGVTLHLMPGHYIGLAKLGMLAPEGRCRTFDASANGFVPSEGCGMVALKRLADALSDGDRVYAVIRGTALNQDGRTNVLTAPNGLAQQAVIRAALENAHVRAADITYVETHGTGTELGDPIEVEALAEAIGKSSPAALPCALGAVKTNVGHLEAAAGIAGLMKVALSLEHQEIPKNLHFEKLNPHISLAGTRFFLPTSNAPWPRGEGPRFAGVSSFGFSGTNAHIILEESPRVQTRQEIVHRATRPYVLPISARTPEALQSYARAYQSFLQEDGREVPLYDLCQTAACRRSHLEERFALTAADQDELLRLLDDLISGGSRPGIARGRADRRTDNIVFICSGQGSQWAQMGTSLLCDEPVFRAAIEDCEQAIQRHAGWSLVEELSALEQNCKLGDTEYAQPAIFAIEVGLARLWHSWGIVPAAIIGHSAGELAAAHIAGVLSLDEAVRVVVTRGRLMQAGTGRGKMAMVHLPAASVMKDLGSRGTSVSIAAVNSPESTVISGDPNAVQELLETWRGRGIDCRLLPVNYAFHSAQMRPYSEALVRVLGSVERNPEKIPIISTVLGRYTRGEELDAAYWGRNVLQTVRFGPAVRAAMDQGLNRYIEVGPHPVLLSSVGECLGVDRSPENLIPSMRRYQDELTVMLSSLGTLYASGSSIEWKSVYRKVTPAVAVPTYPYQRQRYWLEAKSAPRAIKLHPLLGGRVRSPSIKGIVFETRVDTDSIPYLKDHKIEGRVLLPMTAFIEMVQLAARQAAGGSKALLDVTILESLELRDDGSVVQVVLEDDGFQVFSQEGETWKLHATGRIAEAGSPGHTQTIPASADFSGSESHYARLESLGVDFGPAFRTVEGLSVIPGQAWVHVRLLEPEKRESAQYLFHPSLLDGCLQAAVAGSSARFEAAYFPFSFERFEMYQPVGDEVWARAVLRPSGDRDLLSDIEIHSNSGEPLARVVGLHMRQRKVPAASKIYTIEWREAVRDKPEQAVAGKLLILSDDWAGGEALAGVLKDRGYDVRLANPDSSLNVTDGVGTVIRLGEPDVQSTLLLIQELIARFPSRPPHLWIITTGAVAASPADQCEGIWQAPVWGMARTVAMEHPELRCTRVDLDPSISDYGELANEIANWDGEEEVAFRAGKRLVPRLARTRESIQATQWTVPARGSIEKLALAPLQRRTPAAGEVEVEVEASALNFRDVLNVLGMYPGNPGQPGIDFCGRISRVGADVTYQPGDRVMGIAQGTLASFVTTSAAQVVRVPAGWAPTAAAAVPNVFLTAWHCLVRLGKIQRGERILIHAGAGGVGLAAIQVAQQVGAEIFATAGTEEKREYLRSLGVTHTFSSRTLDFAREIAAITDGKGVDLVLNSLAGEFIDAGFATLAQGGRFIEIGKNGIWTAERVAALEKPVRYFVVDLTTVIESTPETIQADLFAFRQDFEAGSLRPIPTKVFEFEDAPSAFRYMAQAKHVGKIVLRHPVGPRIAQEATYLITGGLGAIGLEMARWLVAGGARHLVLLGRNAPSSQAREAIEKIRNTGAQVEIRAADVSQRADIERVLRELERAMPPLAGIIHAAGVLEDGVITQQSADRIARVMAPKAIGAWNLHELTAAMPLDFFILCSSIASLTGSPAQAGYAAANAFLDALAHYRRARGLPALSVNWGAWTNAGMAARIDEQGRRRALPCITPMSVDDCLRCLEQAVASGNAQVAIADVDWLQLGSAPGLISGLAPGRAHPKPARPADDFLSRLEAAPPGNRRKFVMDYLRETARQILGLSSSYQIDARQPLMHIGLDSLMAVEFRNQLATALKRPLSATVLFDHPTIAALADFLEGPETPATAKRSDDLLEGLEVLSEDDAAQMLRMELERGSR
jgi:acyl transferase domain-containing protein